MNDQPNIERRLRIEDVMSQTGLSRASIYRKEKAHTFPAHIKDGTTSLWVESEVQTWIREGIAAARAHRDAA